LKCKKRKFIVQHTIIMRLYETLQEKIIMDYRVSTKVYANGEFLGLIAYLIVAPYTRQVTHIVIQQATNPKRKIVSLDMIELQTKRAIILPRTLTWEELPDYQSEHYISVDENLLTAVPKSYLHPLYCTFDYNISEEQHGVFDDELGMIGMSVFDTDREFCGQVVGWEDTGNPVSAVIQLNSDEHDEIYIPIRWISYTKEQNLYLDVALSTLFDIMK
ncbi:MAG: hypothetical protein ACFE0Q_04870, partial [Anaerolineae bacterium]